MTNAQGGTALRNTPKQLRPRHSATRATRSWWPTSLRTATSRICQPGRTAWQNVMGVCRRMLHQEQDAEDAFQAVFLVLARKAASIRKGEAVGSLVIWGRLSHRYEGPLGGASSACEKRAHSRRKSKPPWTHASCRELQALLDHEVAALARKVSRCVVLCCLEGLSKSEAARE